MCGQYRIAPLTTRSAATFVVLGIAGLMPDPSFAQRAVKELAAAIWRPLAKDGDELARKGLAFLKRKLKQHGMRRG